MNEFKGFSDSFALKLNNFFNLCRKSQILKEKS